MGQPILYGILFLWIKSLAIWPLRVLYVFSDMLCFLVYRVVKYRLKVVRANLLHSFPDWTDEERRRTERKFYHHFADYIMETVKLAHLSHREALRRACIRNPEMIKPLLEQGHTCLILLMGHYGNWEWFTGSRPFFGGEVQVHPIYRPLTNRVFDRLFLFLRSRLGAFGIRKSDVVRDVIRLKQASTPSLVLFIADQTPSRANLHYWTTFLHQETAMLTGPERIAVKLNLPVIFVDIQKIRRGYYSVDFELITDRPKEMPRHWITEEYARRMERCILREPAYWLWTHKRWKYHRHEESLCAGNVSE
ncbi:MAG: lysophospholipid acyltransferase family protein [Tannerella sp.]|jgi:KDO2-lipid IV(A) lauroyltransferase|nr:lysophospholipid acyltransferase family protein [Tannerella sp.]